VSFATIRRFRLSTGLRDGAILLWIIEDYVQAADSSRAGIERRRSERVFQSAPVIVRGVDLLSQPFEERTATLAFNLHGCRYSSKHYLPKNAWVTIESVQGINRYNVRARVSWIQRPHSVRDYFQIAVEFESASDIWALDSPPADWISKRRPASTVSERSDEPERFTIDERPANTYSSSAIASLMENLAGPMMNTFSDSFANPEGFRESEAGAQSPLLRELKAELYRQAQSAVEAAAESAEQQLRRAAQDMDQSRSAQAEESLQRGKQSFEQAQTEARQNLFADLEARQEQFLTRLQSEFENGIQSAREVLGELEQKAQLLRSEAAAATAPEAARDETVGTNGGSVWRERLASEMKFAQAEWNELLESSLDSSMRLLAEQLSEGAKEVLRSTEQKMSDRFMEIQQPLAQLFTDSRDALSGVKAAVENEVARARTSLTEIEDSAARTKEYAAQLEAASHDTLNQLHRRLEGIVETQTDEMNRRVEKLAAGAPEHFAMTLDAMGKQLVERTAADVEAKLVPHLDRVPELVRELSTREVHIEEGLRLYRERIRQVADNNQREVVAKMADALSTLYNDFESVRADALAKWHNELESSTARASHSAAESVSRASDWVQQESQARLQVLVEQTLTTAAGAFQEKTTEAAQLFGVRLEGQSSSHLSQVSLKLEEAAEAVGGRAQSQLEAAADAAAASFGQVLRGISDHEAQQFRYTSWHTVQESERQLRQLAGEFGSSLAAASGTAQDQFRELLKTETAAGIGHGRSVLETEIASLFDEVRARRDAEQKIWVENLERLSEEVTARQRERLQTSTDAWIDSSVRRLNEHGQDAIEALKRSAEQALRDSWSKVLEGIAEALRDRPKTVPGLAATLPEISGELSEQNPVPNQMHVGGQMQ